MLLPNVQEEIDRYLDSQVEPKRSEMRTLHALFLQISPGCRLWLDDGKDETGKIVSNPNVGYGCYTKQYANGRSKEFFRIGLSANTTGISVYVLGLQDKHYLSETFGKSLGKASVTGYCIKFKALKDIRLEVLAAAVRHGLEQDAIS